MAAGAAASAVGKGLVTDGDVPLTEGGFPADVPGLVAGMNLVTGPAGAALFPVDMDIVQVLRSVAESGGVGGGGRLGQGLVVALETEGVLVGRVGGVTAMIPTAAPSPPTWSARLWICAWGVTITPSSVPTARTTTSPPSSPPASTSTDPSKRVNAPPATTPTDRLTP